MRSLKEALNELKAAIEAWAETQGAAQGLQPADISGAGHDIGSEVASMTRELKTIVLQQKLDLERFAQQQAATANIVRPLPH